MSDADDGARVVDFHVHSNASDGFDPPREVIRRARAVGLRAVALTDHDTVAGLAEGRAEAQRLGLEFIDGVELSSVHEGRLIHILGHFIDPGAPELGVLIRRYGEERRRRMAEIIGRLVGMGVAIDAGEFERLYGDAPSITRGQLSAYLLRKGLVRSREEVFGRYIGENGPAYVALDMIPPAEAVGVIVAAGGAATFAHPHLSDADEIVPELVEAGLVGIEVDHPAQDERAQDHYRALAERHGLLALGGSDCHGARPGPERLGTRAQPLGLLRRLRARCHAPG